MSDDNPQLPPELEWDQMEQGILQKMEALEASQKPTSFLSDRTLSLILGITILLMLLLLRCSLTIAEGSLENPVVSQKGLLDKPQDINTPSNTTANFDQKNNAETQTTVSSKTIKNTSENQGLIQSQHGLVLDSLPNKTNKLDKEKPFVSPPINQIETIPSVSKSTINTIQDAIALLPLKQFRATSIAADRLDTQLLFNSDSIDQKKPSRIRRQVILSSGLSLWNPGYGNNIPERSAYESQLPSFQAQFNYVQPLKNNFSLQVGMYYQQLESRLDWTTPVDYTVTLEDAVLEVYTNSLTGQQSEVRGPVDVTVPANRIVRHYNTIQLLQIPVAVGKSFLKNKWQTDVMVGTSLNFYAENNGRTLIQGQVIDYEGANTALWSNQWKWNALVASRLTYRMNTQLGISTGIQFQKSLSNWSLETDIKMRPQFINLEMGLNYMF